MVAIFGFVEAAASVDCHLLESCLRRREVVAPVHRRPYIRDGRKLRAQLRAVC